MRQTSVIGPLACLLMLLVLAAGCSSSRPVDRLPDKTRLASCPVERGTPVLVRVNAADDNERATLAGIVTAVLQSQVGAVPARDEEEAEVVVRIDVRDLYLASIERGRMNASRTLGNTAVGTTLGMAIGGLAGRRTGALIGAGTGAAVGLAVSAMDTDTVETWAISADVAITRRGEEERPEPYATSAADGRMNRDEALDALGGVMGQDIARAMR